MIVFVYIAELQGLLEGLKLEKSMSLDDVKVNIDSQLVVKAINDKDNNCLMGRNLTKKITYLLSPDWTVQIKHVYPGDQFLCLRLN